MLSEGHVAFKYIFLPEAKYVVSPVASILLKRKKKFYFKLLPFQIHQTLRKEVLWF